MKLEQTNFLINIVKVVVVIFIISTILISFKYGSGPAGVSQVMKK